MSDAPQQQAPRKPKRRFFRFGLKAMLLFIAIVAVWLGIATNRADRQRRAVEAISELGGEFAYDYQKVRTSEHPLLSRFPNEGFPEYMFWNDVEPPGPEWLRNVVGDHYFITPLRLSVRQQMIIDQDVLAHLRDLPKIEEFWVHDVKLRTKDLAHLRHLTKAQSILFGDETLSAIEDEHGFEFLAKCTSLQQLQLKSPCFGDGAAAYLSGATDIRTLILHDTAIGDAGVAHFKRMRKLEHLGLGRTNVGDAGLEHLKSLVGLRTVELLHTKATKQGVSALKAAMPNCKVVY
jgi:hypothetical protein